MKDSLERRLEDLLRMIEFPGEEGQSIRRYLKDHRFVDRVMERILQLGNRTPKAILWGILCLMNLMLLLLFGTDQFFIRDFFALQGSLAPLFFLFLGLAFLGSLIGLVLCIDTSWLDQFLHRVD